MRFEIYKSKTLFRKQRYHWRLVAGNNEVVCASSEGFVSSDGAIQNADLTRRMLNETFTKTPIPIRYVQS